MMNAHVNIVLLSITYLQLLIPRLSSYMNIPFSYILCRALFAHSDSVTSFLTEYWMG